MVSSVPNSELLDEFCDAIWLEDGLSKNTIESYRRDLRLFGDWLSPVRGKTLAEAAEEDITAYLAHRVSPQVGIRKSTQSRLISSLKRLYRFSLQRGRISLDPTIRVDAPKTTQRFPKTLSEADVEALLAATDVENASGVRDRAMLELVYACGLRVSELVNIKLSCVDLNSGVVRVLGKGAKER